MQRDGHQAGERLVLCFAFVAEPACNDGLRIITGRTQQPMMALVGDSLRATLILSIATGAATISSNLYWTLTDGTTSAITALVSQNSDSPYANIDKNLAYMQGMLSAIDSLASGGDPSIDSAKDRAKWFSGIGIAGPGVIGGSILLLNKIAIALFVGFGPLFIMCLLFEQTKSLFSKWLLYGIGTVFSLAVLSFMVGLANNVIQGVAIAFLAKFAVLLADTGSFLGSSTVSEGITSMALQQGGIGLVLTTLIVSAPPMAAAFFQGTLGSYMTYSAFGSVGSGSAAVDAQARAQGRGNSSLPPVSPEKPSGDKQSTPTLSLPNRGANAQSQKDETKSAPSFSSR